MPTTKVIISGPLCNGRAIAAARDCIRRLAAAVCFDGMTTWTRAEIPAG